MINEKYCDYFNLKLNGEFPEELIYLLKKNKERQKLLIEQQAAYDINFNFGFDKDLYSETIENISTLLIRTFNIECCNIMASLKDEDVHVLGEMIEKIFYQLKLLGEFKELGFNISISFEYFNLKLDELLLYSNCLNPDKKIDHLINL